jgi:hypothetical protein
VRERDATEGERERRQQGFSDGERERRLREGEREEKNSCRKRIVTLKGKAP